nr:nucleoside-diphosphate sugar epimerase/dehydratase [Pandoraea eparura]
MRNTRKTHIHRLLSAPRPTKQAIMIGLDIALLLVAGWAAFALRLSQWYVPNHRQLFLILVAPLLALPVFVKCGMYRSVIRYMGEYALWAIVRAVTFSTVLWAALAFLTEMTGYAGMPRSVPLLYWMLGTLMIGGSRFLARWLLWVPVRERFNGRQVLIYGAGDAGRQLSASLGQGRDLFPAGFLDDAKGLHGTDVGGLRVYPPDALPKLIEQFDIRDVIVTLPNVSNARRREVVAFLETFPVRVRILPAVADIASGRHLVNMVREVSISDLLGRDPVAADRTLMGHCITGKRVLVTGAGGSIGAELCRQIVALAPAALVLLDSSEHALYQVERHISAQADCVVTPCLGSAEDAPLLDALIRESGIQTIYHAAAHKHVPLVEANVIEGARNNVIGTFTVADAAFRLGVETFVLISTDKAVRPTNVMGATKRCAELIVQDFARRAIVGTTGQRFCAVRFGNVLGSSGSVIPLFKDQISQGGPITLTHEDVTRYFMSIHEAVELVIQAGSLAKGGEVFLLDMGEPVKIADLARNMIRLAGHSVRDEHNPEGDIEILVTGLRPGEKLYEELLIASANARETLHPKIMRADEPCLTSEQMEAVLGQLQRGIDARDAEGVRALLMNIALRMDTGERAPGYDRRAIAANQF